MDRTPNAAELRIVQDMEMARRIHSRAGRATRREPGWRASEPYNRTRPQRRVQRRLDDELQSPIRGFNLEDDSSMSVVQDTKSTKMSPMKYEELAASPSHVALPCVAKFNQYAEAPTVSKRYLRKLMHICTETSMKCENPRDILQHLQNKYAKNNSKFEMIINEKSNHFDQLYNFWLSLPSSRQPKLFRGLLKTPHGFSRFMMRIANKGDFGDGVVRNTFTRAVDDMIAEFFEPADKDPKANRYVLKVKHANIKVRFAGEFISFCLLNEIPIPYRLSRSLLVRMIYKPNEIDPDVDVMYAITDYPKTDQVIARQLIYPQYVDMDELKKANSTIPKELELEFDSDPDAFFELVKEHQRIRVRSMVSTESAAQLTKGFFLHNIARKHSWTVDRIDQLLSGNVVNEESSKKLLQKLKLNRASPLFVQMFEQLVAKKDFAFIELIMQYWSGLRKIDMDIVPAYQVLEIEKGLPLAQTCFNMLKVPRDVKSADMLLERFKKAITESGNTFGLD